MKYKAILFDMDGTVLDTIGDLLDSVNYSLRQFAMPEVSLAETKAALGNGSKYLIEHVAPEGTAPELVQQVLEFYKPWYNEHCLFKTRPYDGIPELLDGLISAGYKVAIVSNKPDAPVQELRKKFFPAFYAIGESPSIRRKPWPDMPTAAARLFGVENGDCLYVGDSEVDILTAKNSGMDCVSVSWGFRTAEQLAASGASVIVNTVDELKKLLMK